MEGVKLMTNTIEPSIPTPLLTAGESALLDEISMLSKSQYSMSENYELSENMDSTDVNEEDDDMMQEYSNEIASKNLLRIQAKYAPNDAFYVAVSKYIFLHIFPPQNLLVVAYISHSSSFHMI